MRAVWLIPVVAALVFSSLAAVPPAVAAQPHPEVPLDGWDTNGTVYAVKVVGNTLYLGGAFSTLRSPTSGTVPRANLAAIDVVTGQVLPFTADTNSTVRAIESDGSTVWVGGTFSSIGGAGRSNLAAVEAATGEVLEGFDVAINGAVYGLAHGGDRLYASGGFTAVAGVAQSRVAALNPATGIPDPGFQAGADAAVRDVAVSEATGRLFVGGGFLTIGSQPWAYLAELDPVTGLGIGPGFSQADAPILDLDSSPDGSHVFAAVAGFENRAQAWTTHDGERRWYQAAMGDTQAVSYYDGTVYFGFHEGFDGDLTVRMLAADALTGELEDYRPSIDSFFGVWAIDAESSALAIGGSFTQVSGIATRGVAIFPGPNTPPDSAAPTAPSGLVNLVPSGESVSLVWDPAIDDRGVSHYRVARDGSIVGVTMEPSFVDETVAEDTAYWYQVQAADFAGNISPPSTPLVVKTWTTLVNAGDSWRYRDVPQGSTDWQQAGFDDSGWALGSAQLGFGEGDEATVLAPGMTTYYFRRQITMPADRLVADVALGLVRDDGAIIYVNGVEVHRSNMPTGPVTADTRAATVTTGHDESRWYDVAVDGAAFQAGVNVIAVEVHQSSPASSDISFDLHVEAELGEIEIVDVTRPSRPGALVARPRSATRVKLLWEAASDDVGVVGYRVFMNGDQIGYTSNLKYVVRGLLPETEYRFKVYAVDAAENVSPRSRIARATTFADTSRPSRPKNTTVTASVDSIFIDWDPATDNVGISHYWVKIAGVVSGTTTDTSWVVRGLEPGTEYTVVVRAVDTSGNRSRRVLRQITTLSD